MRTLLVLGVFAVLAAPATALDVAVAPSPVEPGDAWGGSFSAQTEESCVSASGTGASVSTSCTEDDKEKQK